MQAVKKGLPGTFDAGQLKGGADIHVAVLGPNAVVFHGLVGHDGADRAHDVGRENRDAAGYAKHAALDGARDAAFEDALDRIDVVVGHGPELAFDLENSHGLLAAGNHLLAFLLGRPAPRSLGLGRFGGASGCVAHYGLADVATDRDKNIDAVLHGLEEIGHAQLAVLHDSLRDKVEPAAERLPE